MSVDLNRRRPASCLSDRALDLLAANEQTPEGRAVAEQHLETCTDCAARARQHQAARTAFPLEAPPFAKLVERVARARRRWTWRWLTLPAGLLAAAGAIALVVRPPAPLDATRIKGGESLTLFVLHAGVRREAAAGETVHPGDRLQLAYTTARARHLAVLSRDAAGRAAVVFPQATAGAPVPSGTRAPLPYSLALDQELGAVTLYGLFCEGAEPLAPVRDRLERLGGATTWPAGCHVDRLVYDVRP